jgi:RimJ/RimL family protein N-acetyltransferase
MFTTDRLVARPWSSDDLDAAYAIYSQPEMVRYLGNPVPHESPEMTRAWLARIEERSAAHDGKLGFWAVTRAADAVLVGGALCAPFPNDDEHIEIGWHVGPAYQGQGYATEFAHGIVDYARSIALPIVYAVVNPENTPSLNVARKLGMRHIGQTDRYYSQTLEFFELPLS